MKSTAKLYFVVILFSAMSMLTAFFSGDAKADDRGKLVSVGEDGSECYERDVKKGEQYLKKMEAAEKSGRIKEAYEAATRSPEPDCLPDSSYERMYGVVERNYRKLGQQAEKSGRIYDAYKYYIYPYDVYFRHSEMYRERMKKYYSLEDADRTMLAYAKSKADDYEAVKEAVNYFKSFDKKPARLKDAYSLANHGGDRLLAKEEKDFAARRYKVALDDLKEARNWFELADDDKRAQVRAKQRSESLLAESAYGPIESAFEYFYEFNLNLDTARARANKLGDAADRKGDLDLAAKFYSLSGDSSRQDMVSKKQNAIQEQQDRQEEQREQARIKREKAEPKRQEQFKKGQESLEKELGF